MENAENVIIIGAGPAGYTAAMYTAREDFKPIVITGIARGGQLMLTTKIENYPGFPEGILGPDLMDMFSKQAESFGTRFINDNVTDIDLSKSPFRISVGNDTYYAKAVILAMGASAKWLNIESEQKFIGKGVSSCATCDAAFFKHKNVIVIGGGDTAMEDSLFLTKFADSVTIVHRRNEFRASKIMQSRVLANPKIRVLFDTGIEEIMGNEKVNAVKLKNLKTNEVATLPIDGVFVAIGYTPNTSFLEGKLKLDEKGYIITKDEVKTDIEGVFVAGDVADKVYRQAITAAGSGAKAALEVRNYLQELNYRNST
ncbi:MAG: thioredoxin-disulfide reductase [Candidatus Micrarchaeaceae archaeon]|jgi:thioredoxin reductase (NADPH)